MYLTIYWTSYTEIFQEGEKLPNEEVIEGEKNKVKLADFFGKKRGILIGVPGAFTPGCSQVSADF